MQRRYIPSHSLLRPLGGALVAALAALPAAAHDRAGPATAAVAATEASSEAVAPVPLPALVVAIAGWVAADLGLPVPAELPRIAFADQAAMAAIRDGEPAGGAIAAGAQTSDLIGLYDTRIHTLYLPAGWTGGSVAELSILVHEMVHHLQTVSGQIFACPAAREKPAFAAQERWLETFGETLEGAIGIDRFTLFVATNCMH